LCGAAPWFLVWLGALVNTHPPRGVEDTAPYNTIAP